MNFRTVVSPPAHLQGLLTHHTPVMLIGSCFCENIGQRLESELFDVSVNPFGPLYNPASISRAIAALASPEALDITPETLIERDGLWHHFMFHSRYSASNPEEAQRRMNLSATSAREYISKAKLLILTLGTIRVFEFDGDVVANCHKLPAKLFAERHLTLEESTRHLRDAIIHLRSINSECTVMLTVSPIRYLGEGAHRNTLSKATLQLACDAIASAFDRIIYFPAYEIMMDDLRDYRFYADDMKHPSPLAVKYIYDRFAETFFTPATREAATVGAKIAARLSHRHSDGSRANLSDLERMIPQHLFFLRDSLHRFYDHASQHI